jgi:hypothetical protein
MCRHARMHACTWETLPAAHKAARLLVHPVHAEVAHRGAHGTLLLCCAGVGHALACVQHMVKRFREN